LNYRIRFLAFILILAASYACINYAQPKLFIKKGKEDYPIDRYISVLKDKDNKLTIQQAASDSMRNKYVYYNKETLNFWFTGSSFWVRLIVVDTISNPSSISADKNTNTWLLVKNDPMFEDIRLFYKGLNTKENKYFERRAGSIISPADKAIKISDFIGSFPVQKNVPDTVYLRLNTKSQFIISLNLLTPDGYVIRSSERNFFHGILYGIFILLIVYNTLLYFSIKDKTYLFYVLYILSFTLATFVYEGYYFDIFGRTFIHDYYILTMGLISIQVVFWLFFTREFLSLKTSLPLLYKPMVYLTIVLPLIDVYIFTFEIGWLVSIWAFCILVIFILGFIIGVINLKKGNYISRYYLLALGGLLIGIFMQVVVRNNLLQIPYNIWTWNAANLGVLWEALILAATVGYRFSYLKAEKEKEKSLMRSQIAADLHDEVGSYLSTISLQSRLMMNDRKLNSESKEQLNNIVNISGIITDTIRDIVWFINPFHDKSEDLFIRMKELASKMLANLNYTISSDGNNEQIFDLLPDLNMRRHIYLIFKEILNNVIKHSDANEVSILFAAENKKFIMSVADNGKGFIESDIVPGEGLKNLRNRAAQAGAQILIESNGRKGTKIILEVPL